MHGMAGEGAISKRLSETEGMSSLLEERTGTEVPIIIELGWSHG
jgi:hypothetical protein